MVWAAREELGLAGFGSTTAVSNSLSAMPAVRRHLPPAQQQATNEHGNGRCRFVLRPLLTGDRRQPWIRV